MEFALLEGWAGLGMTREFVVRAFKEIINGENKKVNKLHTCTISKQIELESPNCSGPEPQVFKIATKPLLLGLSSSIRLEVEMI